MSRGLIIRPEAETEIADAFSWHEDRVKGLGDEFLRCLDAVILSILRAPQQYPRVHRAMRRAITRRFPYEVFFVDDAERIVILAVFHAKRNPESWRRRSKGIQP